MINRLSRPVAVRTVLTFAVAMSLVVVAGTSSQAVGSAPAAAFDVLSGR